MIDRKSGLGGIKYFLLSEGGHDSFRTISITISYFTHKSKRPPAILNCLPLDISMVYYFQLFHLFRPFRYFNPSLALAISTVFPLFFSLIFPCTTWQNYISTPCSKSTCLRFTDICCSLSLKPYKSKEKQSTSWYLSKTVISEDFWTQ